MARKSRKHLNNIKNASEQPTYKYIAGVYLRVSVEGKTSIENQRFLADSFIELNQEISLHKVYIDNGVSSFADERPEFDALINDAANGIINCIIVSDLSRFGRNYLETGDYICRIFPTCGIRFISLRDHYDSKNDIGGPSLGVLIKTIINSSYSSDVSEKIKSTIRTKQQNGSFIAAKFPYGYTKKFNNGKTDFAIDEDAAEIVRNIFAWALLGESAYSIAGRLNELGTSSPKSHAVKNNRFEMVGISPIWTHRIVTDILQNRAYIGELVMGKTRNPIGKLNQPHKIPKNEWIISKNHHSQIISTECFEKLQSLLRARKREYIPKQKNTFSDEYLDEKLFCGICGRKMKRRVWNQKLYYLCPRLTEARRGCFSRAISADNLKKDIFECIQTEILRASQYKAKQSEFERSLKFKLQTDYVDSRLLIAKSKLSKFRSAKTKLYLKVFEGETYILSDYFIYEELVEQKIRTIEAEITMLEKHKMDYNNNFSSDCWWVNGLLRYAETSELLEEMYNFLIQKISVNVGDIDVRFKISSLCCCS
jgi:DNA invertase Pin-like site-specific DNA recombinase